jgi:hypothetical protein
VHLEERPVQVQVVDAGAGQVTPLPGVELGAQPLADPATGRAADARVLAEDLHQHRFHVAVRQPSHPAGDHQGLQRVGPRDALPEQLVAQRRVGVAQLGALQPHRPQRRLQGAGLLPAVAVALRRVPGAALVAAAAELLADDLLDDTLEGQPHRQPRDLLDDAQQLPARRKQLMDLGADGLGGRYSYSHGRGSSFVSW